MIVAYATFHKNLSETAMDKNNIHIKVPAERQKKKKKNLRMISKHVRQMAVDLTFHNKEAPTGTPNPAFPKPRQHKPFWVNRN